MSTGIPSMTPHISSSVSRPEDRDINTATGVELTPRQRIAVGSLLEVCSPFSLKVRIYHIYKTNQLVWEPQKLIRVAIRRTTELETPPDLDRMCHISSTHLPLSSSSYAALSLHADSRTEVITSADAG
jgi:hypothetical protein